MVLTKLYQVVEVGFFRSVWKTYRTEQECLDYLAGSNSSAFMTVTLTVMPIWTNVSQKDIEKMLGNH
jgi:hypothetical protein